MEDEQKTTGDGQSTTDRNLQNEIEFKMQCINKLRRIKQYDWRQQRRRLKNYKWFVGILQVFGRFFIDKKDWNAVETDELMTTDL